MISSINEWSLRAHPFQLRLDEVKGRLPGRDFDWYPYDSIGNLCLLEKFLTGDNRQLDRLLGAGPVLDLCCGDGDLSFFLESEGCSSLHAVDWPPTNHNFLQGLPRLKQALDSRVEIFARDLDSRFALPAPRYSCAFFFGGLYHLKNPFYVLETLARHAYHCFLSTRIARFTPDAQWEMRNYPVAYLVSSDELNDDWSNYWVFSELGLKRLLRRSGFEILDWTTFGNHEHSDPVEADRDERAFCLLRSRVLGEKFMVTPGEGLHPVEQDAWCWTQRRFNLRIAGLAPHHRRLALQALLPEAVFSATGPVTLRAALEGAALPPFTITAPGDFTYAAPLPAGLPANATLAVELDRWLAPDSADRRERGLILRLADLDKLLA